MTNYLRDITLRSYKVWDVLDWYSCSCVAWVLENEDKKYQEAYNEKLKELYRQEARDLINYEKVDFETKKLEEEIKDEIYRTNN